MIPRFLLLRAVRQSSAPITPGTAAFLDSIGAGGFNAPERVLAAGLWDNASADVVDAFGVLGSPAVAPASVPSNDEGVGAPEILKEELEL